MDVQAPAFRPRLSGPLSTWAWTSSCWAWTSKIKTHIIITRHSDVFSNFSIFYLFLNSVLFGFQFCCYFSFPFCVQFPEIPPPRLYLVRSFLLSFLFLLPFGKVDKISMSVCLNYFNYFKLLKSLNNNFSFTKQKKRTNGRRVMDVHITYTVLLLLFWTFRPNLDVQARGLKAGAWTPGPERPTSHKI
jgi:hypothetical protein